MHEPTSRQLYQRLNAHGRRRGDCGDTTAVSRMKAANFVTRFVRKGALTVAYLPCQKTGNLILTVAVIVGATIQTSDALNACAVGMGAVTAARFLIDASRMKSRHGSIGCNPQDLQAATRADPAAALTGTWGDDGAWE